jgi:hypothetical protein
MNPEKTAEALSCVSSSSRKRVRELPTSPPSLHHHHHQQPSSTSAANGLAKAVEAINVVSSNYYYFLSPLLSPLTHFSIMFQKGIIEKATSLYFDLC